VRLYYRLHYGIGEGYVVAGSGGGAVAGVELEGIWLNFRVLCSLSSRRSKGRTRPDAMAKSSVFWNFWIRYEALPGAEFIDGWGRKSDLLRSIFPEKRKYRGGGNLSQSFRFINGEIQPLLCGLPLCPRL
jgi:hypothetical protein